MILAEIFLMEDTSTEFKQKYFNMIMQKSPEERFLMGLSMAKSARLILMESLPQDMNTSEKKIHLFERFYGFDIHAIDKQKIIESISKKAAKNRL